MGNHLPSIPISRLLSFLGIELRLTKSFHRAAAESTQLVQISFPDSKYNTCRQRLLLHLLQRRVSSEGARDLAKRCGLWECERPWKQKEAFTCQGKVNMSHYVKE